MDSHDVSNGRTSRHNAYIRFMTELLAWLSPGLGRVVTNADSATVRFARLADQFTVTGARVDTLLLKINRGDGTLGKLMTDTTMYVQLTELSASLKAFVDDLKKHPGKIPIQVKIF